MSSPNENQGPPPPDRPLPEQSEQSTPPPDAPPADAPPPATETQPQPQPQTSPNTTQTPGTPGRQRNRRPLSSLSFFVPFPVGMGIGQPPNGQDDGTRVGMAWTLEVFPSDPDGNDPEDGAGNEGGHAQEGEDRARDGNEVGQGTGEAPPQAAADANGDAQQAAEAGSGDRPNRPAGAAGAPETRDGQRAEQTIFFIIGPDGQLVQQGGNGAGGEAGNNNGGGGGLPTNFWFPFTLPFTFAQPGPPAPDPAKAAELLNSLPTIGKALLRRVDKIITAEDAVGGKEYDDRGWRCGICLEGMDLDAGSEPPTPHPVKGLPCNHLFHEECLQPWFTSHHTCPTCRLDLDPLRTLHAPRETRGNPLRPAATGSGRATPRNAPHPYARDREARDRPRSGVQTPANPPTETLATPAEATPAPDNQQEIQQTRDQNQAQNRQNAAPEGTPAAATPAARTQGLPGLHEIMSSLLQQATAAVFGELAQGRGPMLDQPITASPAPMERSATAPPGAAAGDREDAPSPSPAGPSAPPREAEDVPSTAEPMDQDQPEAGQPRRPVPERRPHFTFINLGPPRRPAIGPAPTPEAAAAAASGAENTEAPTPAPEAAGTPTPNRAANAERANEARAFANMLNDMPLQLQFLRPPVIPLGRAPRETPAPRRENPTPAAPTFVPQSLGSWTEQREKGLGWRCDAVECLVAAPVPDESAEEMDIDEEEPVPAPDKEMLSIYATLQAPFERPPNSDDPHHNLDFVLLACPHRWHRTCLETAERSAGHRAMPDADGREWVHCQKCRKAGWVTPRAQDVAQDVVPPAS